MARLGVEGARAQAQVQGEVMTGRRGAQEQRRARGKPCRYRWPDEVPDRVLARLLELNAQRADEDAPVDKTAIAARRRSERLMGRDIRAPQPAPHGGPRRLRGTPMTEASVDPSVAIPARGPDQVACWRTGSRLGRTGTRPTDSTYTACLRDVGW